MHDPFDVVVVGTGFASSFFLKTFLDNARTDTRVLVLERGNFDSHQWQIAHRRNSSRSADTMFQNLTPEKPWVFTPSFGGGSNYWWAVTPRMLPNDFRLRTRYGVGTDWPLEYDDLEEYYDQAERIMAVSGAGDDTPFPRLRAYLQLPHRFSDPDRRLKAAYPDQFFHQPTARARVATEGRPACCASGVCGL